MSPQIAGVLILLLCVGAMAVMVLADAVEERGRDKER